MRRLPRSKRSWKNNNSKALHRHDQSNRGKSANQRNISARGQEERSRLRRITNRKPRDLSSSNPERSALHGRRNQRNAPFGKEEENRGSSFRSKDGRMAGQESWKILQRNETADQH